MKDFTACYKPALLGSTTTRIRLQGSMRAWPSAVTHPIGEQVSDSTHGKAGGHEPGKKTGGFCRISQLGRIQVPGRMCFLM